MRERGRPRQRQEYDCLTVYCLVSVFKFVEAREHLRARAGPELFFFPVLRLLATAALTGDEMVWHSVQASLSTTKRTSEMGGLIQRVLDSWDAVTDHGYAVYLVDQYIARHHAPTLAAQLRWAADHIENKTLPVRYLKSWTDMAFMAASTGELHDDPRSLERSAETFPRLLDRHEAGGAERGG